MFSDVTDAAHGPRPARARPCRDLGGVQDSCCVDYHAMLHTLQAARGLRPPTSCSSPPFASRNCSSSPSSPSSSSWRSWPRRPRGRRLHLTAFFKSLDGRSTSSGTQPYVMFGDGKLGGPRTALNTMSGNYISAHSGQAHLWDFAHLRARGWSQFCPEEGRGGRATCRGGHDRGRRRSTR